MTGPQERIATLVCIVFLALLPVVFFWRETLGWLTLGDQDAVFWFFPAYKFVAEQIKSGYLPLWTPYLYSGMPLFAQWQAGALDPINWIYLLGTTSRTLTLSLEISFAISLLGTFSYTRILGFSRRASVFAAVIYGLSGFAVGRTLYPGFLHIVALVPFVLYFIEKLSRNGKWLDVAGGGLIIAWQVFAAHPQPLIYSSLLAGSYALFRLRIADCGLRYSTASGSERVNLQEARIEGQTGRYRSLYCIDPQSAIRNRSRFLAQSALMFIAGAGLAAVQLLPAWEVAGQSVRRQWPYELFTLHSLNPVSLLTTLFPFFHGEGGTIYRMSYWGVYWHHNEAQIYLGALAMSLAIAGAIFAWRNRYRIGVFWSLAAVVGVILSIGKYSGPIARMLYHVPLISQFRSPNRHWMEVTLAVAILAGHAVDRLLKEDSRALARLTLTTSAILASLACFVGGFVLWRKDPAEKILRSLFDLSYFPQGFLQSAGAEFYLPIIVAISALLTLIVFTCSKWRHRWYPLLLAVLLIDFNLYAAFAPINNPDKLETVAGRAVPLSLAVKQSERDPFRYHVMLDPSTGEFNPFWFSGHESATGYDPLMNERYKTFSGIDEAGRTYIKTALDSPDHTLDLLNVRYVFIPPGLNATETDEVTTPILLGQGRTVIYRAKNVRGDRITIVSALTDASEITNNSEVAEVEIKCGSGSGWTTSMRAGKDTAEWAYDRPDMRRVIKHARAAIAESFPGDTNSSFQGHSYLSRIKLPAEMIKCNSARSIQIKSKMTGKAGIDIKRVVFEDLVSNLSTTLARPSNEGLNDISRWRELEDRSPVPPYREFRIFENLRALPRVWVVDHVRAAYEGDQLKLIRGEVASTGERDFDPRVVALVDHETASKLDASLVRTGGTGSETGATAKILERRPVRMRIEVESRNPSMLVLSENAVPGWKAFVDGSAAELIRVNYNLRGVALPPGNHAIEIVYQPASIKLGAVVSMTTALCLLVIVLWRGSAIKTSQDFMA